MSSHSTFLTRRAFLALALASTTSLAACGDKPEDVTTTADTDDGDGTEEPEEPVLGQMQNGVLVTPLDNAYNEGLHHAEIEVENYGTITVELNATNTPITVSNFADLAEQGFYDGLTFHRVIAGFMIQGGDPTGTGNGGSERNIKGEFSANGVVNAIQHKRGVISMARANALDSASSQFFIVHQDSTYLDGNYAAFGKVTEGMEVVDAVATNTPAEDDNGTVAPENQPRIIRITMID